MKHFISGLAGTAALLMPIYIAIAEDRFDSVSAFLWKYRPIVVFAPTADHPIIRRQTSLLKGDSAELVDRKVLLVTVVGKTVSIDGRLAPRLSADGIRTRFGISGDKAASLLVGKDGGVKLRRGTAIPSSLLFSTIDAMPMRKQEMRQRNR
jgi:hypothetical protein